MSFSSSIIYRSTAGVTLNVETTQDLSSASSLQLSIQNPDGTVDTVVSVIDTSFNTRMNYLTTSGTFPVAGIYKIQSVVDGVRGETAVLNVRELFE